MKRYARYLGGLGIIFLIFGAFMALFTAGPIEYVGIAETIVGLFSVGVFLFYYFREALNTISQKREIFYGIAGGLLLLLILIGANVVAHSKFGEGKFDTTANKIHTLSSESINLVKNLKNTIKVVGFYQKASPQKPYFEDLAKKYAFENSKLHFEVIDPDQEPAAVKNYDAAPDKVVLRNEDTKKTMQIEVISEEAITTAIKKVMSEKTKVIYFVQGHNEGDLDDEKAGGLSGAKHLLENEGFAVRPLNLAAKPEIPTDGNVIAAWGAQRSFTKSEIDTLAQYLQRGGSLLVGQNPILATTKDKLVSAGLDPLLDIVGLEFKPAVILEQRIQPNGRLAVTPQIAVADFAKHQITNGFNSQAVIGLFFAQPVAQKAKFTATNVTRNVLASTSKATWAETDIGSIFITQKPNPKNKEIGPLPTAQVAELTLPADAKNKISPKGKIVVFGDANFGTNQLIEAGYNRDFFLNAASYLSGEEEATISIRPKTWTTSTLEIKDTQRLAVAFMSIFLIPQLIMCLGTLIWTYRRSRA
jgi:ABC-type uncharacterized transport system involved in gliding motility auxiliary subunit